MGVRGLQVYRALDIISTSSTGSSRERLNRRLPQRDNREFVVFFVFDFLDIVSHPKTECFIEVTGFSCFNIFGTSPDEMMQTHVEISPKSRFSIRDLTI